MGDLGDMGYHPHGNSIKDQDERLIREARIRPVIDWKNLSGPERDRTVARLALRKVECHAWRPLGIGLTYWSKDVDDCEHGEDGCFPVDGAGQYMGAHYSRNMAAALQLVQKIVTPEHYEFALVTDSYGDRVIYRASFNPSEMIGEDSMLPPVFTDPQESENPAEAICVAALVHRGYEVRI